MPTEGDYKRDLDSLVIHRTTAARDGVPIPAPDSPTERLDRIEGGAQAVLRDAGLPETLRLIEISPGHFEGVLAMTESSPGTPEWYAARILARVQWVRRAMAAGDVEDALTGQQDLDALLDHADLEHGIGAALIAGRHERRRKSEGGRQSSPKAQQWQQLVALRDEELRADGKARSKSERASVIHRWLDKHPAVKDCPAERTIRARLR